MVIGWVVDQANFQWKSGHVLLAEPLFVQFFDE
jgi:hypothetical protein